MQNITPQSKAIYELLSESKPLTAVQIADKLNILPHAVYRSIKVLVEFGFVRQMGHHSTLFMKNTPEGPIDLYANAMKTYLSETFSSKNKPSSKPLDISFIQTRNQLIEMTDTDVEKATKSIDFIVSGHEVPAETILAYKKAVERGVKIRMLVQNLDAMSPEMLRSWKKAGVKIKYFPYMESRIFIYDNQIVYFTSYNPEKNSEALGVRFNYTPFARMMNEMFEQRWKLGKEIN
ncbi:MAG TPA: phospholipase D-like domain-containing protein [Xanthomonadales bacterium]|nr:phospholipase D-like domain-containing protein [Xanthomonadales bacterium]